MKLVSCSLPFRVCQFASIELRFIYFVSEYIDIAARRMGLNCMKWIVILHISIESSSYRRDRLLNLVWIKMLSESFRTDHTLNMSGNV